MCYSAKMKKSTIVSFILGALFVLVIGAATDDSVRQIASSVDRIARSVEILANQRKN